ncbi:MAG: C-terminal domain [Mycobacterium sp.]|nr:C-terminal domain [Mycobacterium sp.]
MIALAHRALDCAVNPLLRALSRSRRACRSASPSTIGSTGSGRTTRARSARRNRPTCSATRSSTRSSCALVRNRVVTATPDGAATGFTPRHSRNRADPTATPSHPPPTNPANNQHRPQTSQQLATPAVAGLRGPVIDLWLVLYRRVPVSNLEVTGDVGLVDFWLERVGFG